MPGLLHTFRETTKLLVTGKFQGQIKGIQLGSTLISHSVERAALQSQL